MAASSTGKKIQGANRVYIEAHGRSYVSQKGVIAVLKSIREHGMPKHVSRSTLKRTRERELDSDTAYGPLFATIEVEAKQGGKKKIPVVAPLPLLANLVQAAPFALFLDNLMSEKVPTVSKKWKICLYCDEVLPGNALKTTNDRKLVAFYWSFMEYGKFLYNEQLWMHICSLRTCHIKNIEGGYSAVFKHVAGLFFGAPHDLRHGVQLHLPAAGTSRFLFAEIGGIVSDEAALKQLWSNKGSSGSLPCFLCQNVVAHSSGLDLHDSTGTLVPSCTTKYGQCIPNRSQAVLEKARMLSTQHPVLGVGEFKTLEQSVGLTFNPQGALWDANFQTYLNPGCVEVTGFDFMHVFFVGGCWNTEVGYLLDGITRVVKPSDLHSFLQTIKWPARVSSRATSGKKAFQKHTSGDAAKCSASEGISLYPCLRSFLTLHMAQFDASEMRAVNSYLALCKVLDILLEARFKTVDPAQLLAASEAFLAHRLVSHGVKAFQPKVHYSLHMSEQLRRMGLLISCWTHERKHRELKKFANNMMSAQVSLAWERSLLEELVLMAKCQLMEFDLKTGVELINAQPADRQLTQHVWSHFGLPLDANTELTVSEGALIHHQLFCKKDVVLCDDGTNRFVAELWLHMQLKVNNDGPFDMSVVSALESVSSNVYRMCTDLSIIPSSWIHKSFPTFMTGTNVQVIP